MTIVPTKVLLAQTNFHQVSQWRLQIQNKFYSDEFLADACGQFISVSQIFKRNGSFVPGPLESRRRLGKRRMVYAFESIPINKFDSWSWWRCFQQYDLTEWKWEPPRSVAMNQETKLDLSQFSSGAWLLSIFNFSKKKKSSSSTSELNCFNSELLKEQVTDLRVAMKKDSDHTILKASRSLNHTLENFLRQHIICEMKTIQLLDEISQDLRKYVTRPNLATFLCCSLYQAAWKGLKASISDTHALNMSETITPILRGLSKLPITPTVQKLVASIIQYLPKTETEKIPYEIYRSIFTSWSSSWCEDLSRADLFDYQAQYLSDIYKKHYSAAEEIISKVENQLSRLDSQINVKIKAYDVKVSLPEIRLKIVSGLENIEDAENLLTPEKLSASNLAKALDNLPRNVMKTLLIDCSKGICEIFQQDDFDSTLRIKKYWLLSISQITSLNNEEFLDLWRYIDTCGKPLSTLFYPELLINRWESHSSLEEHLHIRNEIKTTRLFIKDSFGPWVSLINAIYKCYSIESHFERIGLLFSSLRALGKVDDMGETVLNLIDINPRLSAEILEFIVETLIDHNPETAWKVVMLSRIMAPGRKYRSRFFPNGDHRRLRYSRCPKFVDWMIYDSKINPIYIWKLLRVRRQSSYQSRYRNQPSPKPLHPEIEALFKRMAVAFAHSNRLSPRQAFRNVMHCWHQLCHHKLPIDKIVVKALIHSGITRWIENGLWVSVARQNWLYYLLEQTEGIETADQASQIVQDWNNNITLSKKRKQRELNVLCVGQID
ncbi:putative fungal specific transcription factor domain containing protein [Golovinomyces cichoracearum]|uniref:Putative fungal specific transcription factor domain containing protein n=1 Tax=Golovinomyces cichoracearum TaxID=62708 RepID=A0A420JBJ7_9PEZI|nr:putative fungal specific transcription factor domain containing protein [Golovinomyces cichoracearum]